jgi:heptosyltransferase I
VQIYNFETAWRTGPLDDGPAAARQRTVYAAPAPSLEAVWRAWQEVSAT